ncbi:MAG: nitroreductase family protein [Acidimicrobiales bacterium]
MEPDADGAPPDARALTAILRAATTVPDHGGLHPWRFAVVTRAGQERFGDALVSGLISGGDPPEAARIKMRSKASAAPCAIVLIASPERISNVPEWEQMASAACTGYAVLLAAAALGYGAAWKSAAVLDTPPVRSLFELEEHERLLGWVNVGTPKEPQARSRNRAKQPDLAGLVTVLGARTEPFGTLAPKQVSID